MLENSTDSSAAAGIAPVKRYAPPNQRNRPLGRRKSGGDRLDRVNSYGNDGEKNLVAFSRNSSVDVADAGSSNRVNENPHPGLIPLRGCYNSEAFRLLNDRWAAAMNAYNNPSIDVAERPVLYLGSGSTSWSHFKLPHELMTPAANAGSSGDFLSKLRHAMHVASTNSDN